MKNLFVNHFSDFVFKHKSLDHKEKLKVKYGLEIMYHFITKTTFILFCSFLFGFLKEALLFNLFYLPLRSTAHGFHANSNFQCWLITILTYMLIFFCCKFVILNKISVILIIVISVISFIIWSPSDTKYLPLIRKKDRLRLKKQSILVLLILFVLYTFYKNNIIIFSIIIEIININPITYKIFKTKYNNYVEYT